MPSIPDGAEAIETMAAGWIQQIDDDSILRALPDGATAFVPVSIGGFVPAHAPLVWVSAPSEIDDECRGRLLESFAVGDSRTLQQDVEFGLVQLTDIAVRALSPGVNDPTTACDVTVHIGNVLLAIWERPTPPARREDDGRTVVMVRPSHAAYLERAIGPISPVRGRRSRGDVVDRPDAGAPSVRSAPTTPARPDRSRSTSALEAVATAANTDSWTSAEVRRFEALVESQLTRTCGQPSSVK